MKDNIKIAHPEATDNEIEEAAKVANAHDFISSFPDGYATQVKRTLHIFTMFLFLTTQLLTAVLWHSSRRLEIEGRNYLEVRLNWKSPRECDRESFLQTLSIAPIGQKQRVAIARIILKNPKILLLDEGEFRLAGQQSGVFKPLCDV
jgi:hypothetical protein